MTKDSIPIALGGSGLSFPFWSQWLSSGWSALVAFLGGIVLALSIWRLVLDIRQKRRDLKKD
jgi:hypothetical protein